MVLTHCGLAWREGAPLGEETVLADSGLEGEVATRVGRVSSLAFLSILLESSVLIISVMNP